MGSVSTKYQGWEHALGEKPYVADLERPGLLHGAVVLAEHPRAKVLSIDSEAAQRLPGVERVLTASDLPAARTTGLIVADWPVFVTEGETTRCVGDVLALVLADSEFRARQAAREVVVAYEVLEPVTDPVAALEAESPRVHPGGNLLDVCAFRRGPRGGGLRGVGPRDRKDLHHAAHRTCLSGAGGLLGGNPPRRG